MSSVNRYPLYYRLPKKWKNMSTGAHEKHKKRATCVHEKCKAEGKTGYGKLRNGTAGGDGNGNVDGNGDGGHGKVGRTESGATTAQQHETGRTGRYGGHVYGTAQTGGRISSDRIGSAVV